jgi:hypothetical protein
MRKHRAHRFTATVKIDGINPYVTVPPRTVAGLGGESRQPVLLRLERVSAERRPDRSRRGSKLARDAAHLIAIGRLTPEHWFRTTLVRQRSAVRVYVDTWMREAAGVGVGDRVMLTLKADPGSRTLPIPARLQEALDADEQALAAWNALAPSRRREILMYLNFLKSPSAVERNVRKVMSQLRGTQP